MPPEAQYLALLRGINVGGKNLVKMADLRAAFEEMEFAEVATYIQSGNLLFSAPRQKPEALAARIESDLSRHFGTELKLVLLTEAQLRGVIKGAPRGFGAETHKCDVIFLRKPLTAKKAFALVETREGVDSAWAGKGVLYFARLASKASSSRLPKVVTLPEYQDMTIRSWSTTTKLYALMDSRAAGRAKRAGSGGEGVPAQ
jgi:uncharacterized protein (DUF1697 family)